MELKLRYVFDSEWVSDEYEDYNGEVFEYEICEGELKEYVAKRYAHLITTTNIDIVYDLIDELDYEERLSWDKLIDSYKADIELDFTREAMEWYADKHYIMTKEDYEANEADNYNDERMCD